MTQEFSCQNIGNFQLPFATCKPECFHMEAEQKHSRVATRLPFGHYGRLVLGFWQMFQTVLARVLAILATVSATSQLGGSSEDPAKGCGKVPNRNASPGRKSP
jgi:hypothetical protein